MPRYRMTVHENRTYDVEIEAPDQRDACNWVLAYQANDPFWAANTSNPRILDDAWSGSWFRRNAVPSGEISGVLSNVRCIDRCEEEY